MIKEYIPEDSRTQKIRNLAEQSPFEGERKVAQGMLSKMKSSDKATDPKLSPGQRAILEAFSQMGLKVTYEVDDKASSYQNGIDRIGIMKNESIIPIMLT